MKPTAAATLKRFNEIGAKLQSQKPAKTAPVARGNGDGRRLDVQAYCSHFGIDLVKTQDLPSGGTMYCLKHCVFDENHSPNQSSIIQQTDGSLGYQCFHNSCKGRKWKEARNQISGDQKLNDWMVGGKSDGGNEKHADALIRIGNTAELFKTTDRTTWARFRTRGHYECWPIRSKEYRQWILREFYQKFGTAPTTTTVQSAIEVLDSEAQFGQDGSTREVFIRVARHEEAIYLDLADDAWRTVKITKDGWSVIEEPPVCFCRTDGMMPHPEPVRGGSLRQLDGLANIGSEENRKLIFSFLAYCLNPSGPYPLLCLISEQGSGKSITARILRMLVDPSKSDIRALPTTLSDLAVAGHHSWLPCFDNLSHITDCISDGLCRMSSGAGFGTRSYYTNDRESIFEAARPLMMNGISDFAQRPDLLERAIIVHLPTIPPEKRKTEREILDDFEKVRPALLGALLNTVVLALKNLPSTNLSEYPRMADFAKWTAAAARAFESEPEEMVRLLLGKQDEALASQLDNPLVIAVLDLLKAHGGKYEARPSDLLSDLNDHAPKGATQDNKWPTSGRGMTSQLTRLAPVLRLVQVDYKNLGHGRTGSRVHLERRDDRMPTVMGRDGSLKKDRNGLSAQKQKKTTKTSRKRDGRDGPTATFSPSLPLKKKKKEEGEEGGKEKAAAPPSPPSLRLYPDLLEGEL